MFKYIVMISRGVTDADMGDGRYSEISFLYNEQGYTECGVLFLQEKEIYFPIT